MSSMDAARFATMEIPDHPWSEQEDWTDGPLVQVAGRMYSVRTCPCVHDGGENLEDKKEGCQQKDLYAGPALARTSRWTNTASCAQRSSKSPSESSRITSAPMKYPGICPEHLRVQAQPPQEDGPEDEPQEAAVNVHMTICWPWRPPPQNASECPKREHVQWWRDHGQTIDIHLFGRRNRAYVNM